MRKYTQLTSEQRYQISGLKKAGWKQVQIAAELGVHKSTITRELTRNRGERGWRPKQAQRMRDARRQGCINGQRFSVDDWTEVARLTRQDFSPEQTAARLELEGGLSISHQVIYQHIMQTSVRVVICGGICVARSRIASAMPAARNGGAASRIGSALMNGPRL